MPPLPKYVYHVNGRVVYRPRIKPEDQALVPTDSRGFLKPPCRLASSAAPDVRDPGTPTCAQCQTSTVCAALTGET